MFFYFTIIGSQPTKADYYQKIIETYSVYLHLSQQTESLMKTQVTLYLMSRLPHCLFFSFCSTFNLQCYGILSKKKHSEGKSAFTLQLSFKQKF
ncbi:unnamed protein product [Rotaria magnacalcarata]